MNLISLFRWSSRLAAITLTFAITDTIPKIFGVSNFEGGAGYLSLILILPTLILVTLAMRAWGNRLVVNSIVYRVTLAVYCLLSILFLKEFIDIVIQVWA